MSRRTRRILRWTSLGVLLAGVAVWAYLANRGYDVRVDGEAIRCPAPTSEEFGHHACTEDAARGSIAIFSLIAAAVIAGVLLVIARPAWERVFQLCRWLVLCLLAAGGAALVVAFGCVPFVTSYDVDGEIECPAPVTWSTDATYVEGDVTSGMDEAEGAARCAEVRPRRLFIAGAGLLAAFGAATVAVVVRRRTTAGDTQPAVTYAP